MNLEAHLACGWVMANLWPGLERRERFAAVAAAMICDVDGLSYLFGEQAYSNWHHTFGHSVFLALPLTIAAIMLARKGHLLAMVTLVLLGFISHLLGDYFLSGWEIQPLWPVSKWTVMFRPRIGLDHPINVWLSYGSFAVMAASLWWVSRTPLEFIWPKLDHLLARVAARRKDVCHLCTRRTGMHCDDCGKPMCLRDTLVRRPYRLICKSCSAAPKAQLARDSEEAIRG